MPNHSARILVVDDEVNQRSALGSVVTRWGYQVETASDGAEALAKLKDFDADVVITDLNMPNMDGKGLLEELRKLPSPPRPSCSRRSATWRRRWRRCTSWERSGSSRSPCSRRC